MPRCAKDSSRGRGQGQVKSPALGKHSANAGKNGWLARRRHPLPQIALGGIAILTLLALIAWLASDTPTLLRNQAEAAARNGNWNAALGYWRKINATTAARSSSSWEKLELAWHLVEQVRLNTVYVKQSAPVTLIWSPGNFYSKSYSLRIAFSKFNVWAGKPTDYIRPDARRELLRTLTVGLLADRPDEDIRATLRRWVDADPDDVNAQVALWQRMLLQPRATDPDRPSILAALEVLLANHSSHLNAREALITALGDAGEADRGRVLLDSWPESMHDARYWRLQGRWYLEYDHRPQQSVIALQTALVDLPQDWRSWYRLARALHMLGRDTESQQAAEVVSRIREVLDPLVLEPRLHAAFGHVVDPTAVHDVAALCRGAGLSRLAMAWLAELKSDAPQ